MEPLTMFMDEEVLDDIPPSNWVKIMPSRLAEPTQQEYNCSRTNWACARGSFSAAYGKGWLGSHMTATAQTTSHSIWEVVPWWEESSSQLPTPQPGFVEITQSLHGDNPPRVVAGSSLELAKDQGPIQMIGSSTISTCLFRDSASGAMCIDMVTCSMSLAGMALYPQVDGCHIPTLWEVTDLD